MIKFLIYFGLFICLQLASAQDQKIYYQDADGDLIEQKELDQKIEMFKKIASQINEKADVKTTFADTLVKGDSILVRVNFDLIVDGKIMATGGRKDKTRENLIEKNFPDFKLTNLQNQVITLNEFKGKPMMINFWFKNCAPCIDEMPALNKLKEKYKEKIHFIAITFNTKDEVDEFLKTHDFQYDHLVDAMAFCNELNIEAYPYNIFVNANGKVVGIENGLPYMMDENGKMSPGDESYFEDILKKML